jgi:hypothetical protein
MRHPHDADLITRAAAALFTGAPNALLARSCDMLVAKATARSWRQGHRRAPVPVLRQLRLKLQARAAECNSLCREFDIEIARRDGEGPRHPRGFQIVADWDGTGILRDRRWRGGRPRKMPWAKP